jgi:hypothetical protein
MGEDCERKKAFVWAKEKAFLCIYSAVLAQFIVLYSHSI